MTHERVSLCPRRDAGGEWTPAMKRVRTQWSLGPNCWGTRWWSGYQRRLLPLNAQVRGLGTNSPRKGELLCARPVSAIRRGPGSAAGPRAERWGHRTEVLCQRSSRGSATSCANSRNVPSSPIRKSGGGNAPRSSARLRRFRVPLASRSSLCVVSRLGFSFLTFSNFP